MELSGAVCLVTGASSGIGAQTARLLLERGALVAGLARRAAPMEALGCTSVHVADVSDPADALRAADDALARHGRIDVLVNNAGVRIDGRVADVTLEDLDRAFQVNALTPFALAGHLVPAMAERGAGAVANVVAPAVSGGRRGLGAYAASKAALESLTQTLRQEAGPKVAVFAFDPGWVRTALAPDGPGDPADAAARLVGHLAAGRGSREILS